ncbi:MAG: c-type cytochrome [Actinomycetia bacterium]|nr:c-type cytochrome [Actinomycetes bacterium]
MLVAVIALIAAGCSSGSDSSVGPLDPDMDTIPPVPDLDAASVEEGSFLYQAQCAACHGADLSGADDWKTRNEDGTFKPPPHDASGHTWHHPDQLLTRLIQDGGSSPDSVMPAFGGKLTDREIASILDYFKSNWGPDEREFQWMVTWQDLQRE